MPLSNRGLIEKINSDIYQKFIFNLTISIFFNKISQFQNLQQYIITTIVYVLGRPQNRGKIFKGT